MGRVPGRLRRRALSGRGGRSRSGSARMSISTIRPDPTVKPTDGVRPIAGEHDDAGGAVDERRPGTVRRTGGRASPARPRPRRRGPRASPGRRARVGPEHDVRIEDRDERLEVAVRAAARNASTTARCPASRRPASTGAPCTRRRARLASCRAAVGVASTIGAISSNGTANTSCSTKARRSAGVSVSRTTSSASPTESASSASCSGSGPVAALETIGSGHVHAHRLLAPRPPRAQHVEADPGRRPSSASRRGCRSRPRRSG